MKRKIFGLIISSFMILIPNFTNAETTLQSQIDAANKGDIVKLDKNYEETRYKKSLARTSHDAGRTLQKNRITHSEHESDH